MGRVAADASWVVDDAGRVVGQRLADGTVVAAGVVTAYTAAQLSALAAAGGLTPWATYIESDSLRRATATSASTFVYDDQVLYGGYNVALAFDSMTDFNFTVASVSSVTYAAGVITVTLGSAHLMPVGQEFNFWHKSYASTYKLQKLTVASVTSSTIFTAALQSGIDYSDLPATLAAGSFIVPLNAYCSKSWLAWLNVRANQRFRIVSNTAASGDTSVAFLARLPEAMAAWRAAGATMVVGQMVGINDLVYDAITFSNNSQRLHDNIVTILDMIRHAGFRMLISTITPVASGEARAQLRIMSQVQSANRLLQNYAMKYADRMTLIDAASIVTDPTNASGLALANYVNATDKIHYSNWGAYKVAVAEQAKVTAAFPVYRSSLPASVIDAQTGSALTTPTGVASSNSITISAANAYVEIGQEVFIRGATGAYAVLNGRQVCTHSAGNGSFVFVSASAVPDGAVTGTLVVTPSRQLLDDPLMQTTGGTLSVITGTGADVPGQWIAKQHGGVAVTGAASIVNDSEGFGKASRISVTAVAAVDGRAGWAFKNSIGTVDTKMIPGRTYQFEAKLVLASSDWSLTPISEIQFELNIGANGTETWRMAALNQYENVAPLLASGTSTETLHLKTPPLTIPMGSVLNSAQCTIGVRWQAAQASGTLTMDLSRVAFRDVTPDGVEII